MAIDTDMKLLRNIIPYFNDKNFDTHFKKLTEHLSKSRRFLIKMELQRLFSPCQRTIDLRGRVDDVCRPFEFEQRTHYLDPLAITKFEQAVSIYNGFSVGVFEEVTNTENSYRVKQRTEDQQRRDNLSKQSGKRQAVATTEQNPPPISQHQVEIVSLARFHQRCEERANIICKIRIRLRNGQRLRGITSNLSISGSKIKIPATFEINAGETIHMGFVDNVNAESPIKEIGYTVLTTTTQNDFIWLSVKRQHKDDKVTKYLNAILSGQRENSAIDSAHIIEAIRCLGYQQLYINKIAGLPLFFSKQKDQYELELALCNDANKQILSFWQNQNSLQKVAAIFSSQRLNQLLSGGCDVQSTTLYCFTHIARGKKYFYSATSQELAQTGLTDLYCSFGSMKDSWQVYQLVLCPTDGYHFQLPEVLPANLIKQEDISAAQHQQLLQLHNIELMAYLVPISDSINQQVYQQHRSGISDLSQLQQFGHQDTVQQGLNLINTNQFIQRNEDRYSYQTKVFVHYNSEICAAKTVDFSNNGMQVKLEHSIACKKGDSLKIQMPLLQRTSDNEQDSFIGYRVVHLTPDGKTLNLKEVSSTQRPDDSRLISRLIKTNKAKLTAQLSPPTILTKSLNLLFSSHITSLPLTIEKKANSYKISAVIEPAGSNRLFNLFSTLSQQPQSCNIEPLAKGNLFRQLFELPLKQISINSGTISSEVYIRLFADSDDHSYSYVTKTAEQFSNAKQHQEFINQQLGQFFALRIIISRTNELDYKAMSRELIYAAKQASFKTRQLQTELDSVAAVAELIDITKEVKARYDYEVRPQPETENL